MRGTASVVGLSDLLEIGAAGRMARKLALMSVFVVLAVAVVPTSNAVAQGQRFSDVGPDHYAFEAIEWAAEAGVTAGYPDGTFKPAQPLSKSHALLFMASYYDGNLRADQSADFTRADMMALLKAINDGTLFPLDPGIESTAPAVVDGGFDVTITFGQPVTGLAASDVTVVNGSIESLAGSGARYTARIEPAAPGTVVVWVPAGVARGGDGSPNEVLAPLARTNASAASAASPGFDTWNRSEVLRMSRLELNKDEPDWGYTGDVENCVAGTTSQAFRDSVIDRVNWYRQMAGLANVSEDRALSETAQQKALIMLANNDLDHHPPEDWACYREIRGWVGENLALGTAGPDSVDVYMRDRGPGNILVGHRRLILSPFVTRVGTGDVRDSPESYPADGHPGFVYQPAANAMHVSWDADLSPAIRELRGFVAWPPAGYVPSRSVWGRWSFELPRGASWHQNVSTSAATVSVSNDAGPVPFRILIKGVGLVVWAVGGDTDSDPHPAPTDGDDCYIVTVSGVRIDDEIQTPYEYAVCVIDMNAPTGPSVTIASNAPATVTGPFDVTITFSEPVTKLDLDDFVTINGTVIALSGSGREYTATILPGTFPEQCSPACEIVAVFVRDEAAYDQHGGPNRRSGWLCKPTTHRRVSAAMAACPAHYNP